jgi:hypothetical protein
LSSGVAQFVEGIRRLISNSLVLDRCNDSDEDIILNQ